MTNITALDGLFLDKIEEPILNAKNPLKYLDEKKVAELSKMKLKKILGKECLTDAEKAYIKEMRRKFLCRQIAKKHRDDEKAFEDYMTKEINELLQKRSELLQQRLSLIEDIKVYNNLMLIL